MKRKSMAFLLSVIFISGSLQAQNIKTLFILPDQYGANNLLMLEKFEEFGWDITISGVTSVVYPCYWGNTVYVDTIISEINDIYYYNCVIIGTSRWWQDPPNAYGDLLSSPETLDMLEMANDTGLIINASCGGVRVLAAAEIINGINVTGTPYYQAEYTNAGANYLGPNIPPVIDGNIVTTMRGQYYFNQNMEAVMTAFENQVNK
jgi:hypothetical protein